MEKILEKSERREWVVIENLGQQIFGILHRPVQVQNPPVVVILHGFASCKQGSNRCYIKLAESFAKAGIAALRFDFRGSGDSEGALSALSFEDLLSDALAVLEEVKGFQGVDHERIGLFGASLGGSIAVLSANQFQKIKAMALWAPVASGELWYRDFLTRYPEFIQVDPTKVFSNYRGIELNPLFREQFGRMSAYKTIEHLPHLPILHMHGEKDDTVTIAHQEAFRLACPGANARFLKYPDDQHSLGFSPCLPEVIGESLRWFQQHL